MSKPIGYVWYSARSTVGIVLGYNQTEKELRAWIASILGLNEQDDIQFIMDHGAKFPVIEAQRLIMKSGTICDLKTWVEFFGSVHNEIDYTGPKDNNA